MPDEKFLDDLFEAARTEPAVRSLESVEQFVQAAGSGASTSLIVQWLKQHKMNILISASSVMIVTSVLLFSESQVSEITPLVEVQEAHIEQVELPEVKSEPVVENENQPVNDSNVVSEEVQNEEETSIEDVAATKESLGEEEDDSLPKSESQKQPGVTYPQPVTQTKPLDIDQNDNNNPVKSALKEHMIVLDSRKGEASVRKFSEYLMNNLSQLKHEFTSKVSKNEIKKFTLVMDNRIKASFRMQVTGFEKLELHWEVNEEGKIKDVWYRLDSKEKKELDFSKSSKSSVKVKYTHEEF